MQLVREEVEHALDRLVGVVGVQRAEHQVPGLGEVERGLDGLEVAHLADQDHVRRLAQRALERGGERRGVDADFALRDHAALVRVDELDRVLDGEDVPARVLIAVVDQRGERGRLARAGGAGHQDQAALAP